MNPTDKFEQIQIYKRLNPVELEAMVLHHEQQIKDLAAQLLALNKKEKKEWVSLTDEERDLITDKVIGFNSCCGWEDDYARAIESRLKEKNNERTKAGGMA